MKDYLAVIGKAVLDESFRDSLFANGVAAIDGDPLFADLGVADRAHLDDWRTAAAGPKADAAAGLAAAKAGLSAVCHTPPCPYTP